MRLSKTNRVVPPIWQNRGKRGQGSPGLFFIVPKADTACPSASQACPRPTIGVTTRFYQPQTIDQLFQAPFGEPCLIGVEDRAVGDDYVYNRPLLRNVIDTPAGYAVHIDAFVRIFLIRDLVSFIVYGHVNSPLAPKNWLDPVFPSSWSLLLFS